MKCADLNKRELPVCLELLSLGENLLDKCPLGSQCCCCRPLTYLPAKDGRGSRAEVVVDRIIEEQKIDVDAVSGATNSSTVIKKAVENALTAEK